jgi:hypothetical protein
MTTTMYTIYLLSRLECVYGVWPESPGFHVLLQQAPLSLETGASKMFSGTPERQPYLCKASDMIAYTTRGRPVEGCRWCYQSQTRPSWYASEHNMHKTRSGVNGRDEYGRLQCRSSGTGIAARPTVRAIHVRQAASALHSVQSSSLAPGACAIVLFPHEPLPPPCLLPSNTSCTA